MHFIYFGTNISLIKLAGLSGRVIGEVQLDDNFESAIRDSPNISKNSLIIIISEWLLFFTIITVSTIRRKFEIKQNHENIRMIHKSKGSQTDIDLLYELLQKHKKLGVSQLSKLFKVDKEVIKQWGDALENSGLAYVDYPRFGDPEISITHNEEKKSEEKTSNKA